MAWQTRPGRARARPMARAALQALKQGSSGHGPLGLADDSRPFGPTTGPFQARENETAPRVGVLDWPISPTLW